MNRHRAITTVTLLGVLLAACEQGPPDAEKVAAGATTANSNTPANSETLRQRAERAMREQRMFLPAGDSALDHYLALHRQDPGDAGVRAGLEDLQPLLIIAIEQAIGRGALPEGKRLVRHLREMNANAPALGRLQATLADAERLAQARAQATNPEAIAMAEADAAALRQQAETNAARLAAIRPIPSSASTTTSATTGAASIAAMPAPPPAVEPAPPRQGAIVPARPEPVVATPPPAAQAPASEPARSAAGQPPRQLRVVAPVYPLAERQRGLTGEVKVAFTIGVDGSVEDPKVVSSTLPSVFSRAALNAVARWKFEASGSRHPSQGTLVFSPSRS